MARRGIDSLGCHCPCIRATAIQKGLFSFFGAFFESSNAFPPNKRVARRWESCRLFFLQIWVCDSFDGVPPPDNRFPVDAGDNLHTMTGLKIPLDHVVQNFQVMHPLPTEVYFSRRKTVTGIPAVGRQCGICAGVLQRHNAHPKTTAGTLNRFDFDTESRLEFCRKPHCAFKIERLSLLRLDGDLYQSTWEVLEAMYPKLSVGGYCIIDDWGLYACYFPLLSMTVLIGRMRSQAKLAVIEYRKRCNIDDELIFLGPNAFWKKKSSPSSDCSQKK